MTSTINLTRAEAIDLKKQLKEVLDNKDLDQIKIVHRKGELHVTKNNVKENGSNNNG